MRWMLLITGALIGMLFVPVVAAGPVINEIAWGGEPGNPQAEWIELYNTSDQPVNLTGWRLYSSDGAPDIRLRGTIPGHGYFLLERRGNLIPGVHADLIYTGALRDSGEGLFLLNSDGHTVDTANRSGGPWPAGTNSLGTPACATMERVDPNMPDSPANWATSRASGGTPAAQNSVYSVPPVLQGGTFSFTPPSPRPGEPVLFSAKVKNDNAVAFVWSFGDGGTGTGQTASHTYARTGKYSVRLTVRGKSGGITQKQETIHVVAAHHILADFSVLPPDSKQICQSGDPLTFSDESSVFPTGRLIAWTWKFGDGSAATGQTASHTYARGGNYVITHAVVDAQGDKATQTRSLRVIGRYPTAVFTFSPAHPNAGAPVTFNARGSFDPDGTNLSYEWDFNGDGTVDLVTASPTVSHVYSQGGDYSITLTVLDSDQDGAKRSLPFTASIHVNRIPNPCFQVSDFSPHELQTVSFTNCSTDQDGKIVAYHWEFGDGKTADIPAPQHAYRCAGTYTILLTVTDDNGARATASAKLTVQAAPPRVSVNAQPTQGPTGSSFTFTAVASTPCPTDRIVSYAWDFDGDGVYDQTTSCTSVTHSYSHVPGPHASYPVTVNVTSASGLTAVSAPKTITVDDQRPCAAFTWQPSNPSDADKVTFTNMSTDPDGKVTTWHWSFGDGSQSTEKNPVHQFPDDGTYTVTLTVTDDSGVTSSPVTHKITVTNAPPVAQLQVEKPHALVGEEVRFDASKSHDPSPNGKIVHYAWDFDGNGIYDQITDSSTATHTYSTVGTYAATVQVTDDDGATMVSSPVRVTVDKLVARFNWQPIRPTDADMVKFTDRSVDPAGKIVSWVWNFGDGGTATAQSPCHQFPDEGAYTVTLVVTDASGVESPQTAAQVLVTNALPIAKFTAPDTAVAGTPVKFVSQSYDPSPHGKIVHTAWDFGDGTTCTGTPNGCGGGSLIAPVHTYSNPGTYTVELVVIDDDGGLARIRKSITVSPAHP